jgi:hypothetical protein
MKDKNKPLVIPSIKPRNPLGAKRRATIPHQDKRTKTKHKSKETTDEYKE